MKITFLKTDAEKKDSFKIMKQLVSKLEEKSYLKQQLLLQSLLKQHHSVTSEKNKK